MSLTIFGTNIGQAQKKYIKKNYTTKILQSQQFNSLQYFGSNNGTQKKEQNSNKYKNKECSNSKPSPKATRIKRDKKRTTTKT